MRVAVIGLDCAAPRLVFERWRDDLPTLKHVRDDGCYGRLESVHPPITVPAWACMMSGRDPGELGIYGFRNRKDYSYEGYSLANASAITQDLVWDLLGRAGKQVILLGVPPSYPPKPVNGLQVGCFLTPSNARPYTYPPEVKAEVERAAGGYVFDVEGFRTDDKAALLQRIYTKTRKHFAVARHFLKTKPWDFFMMVEMGVDRIHHGFWKYMDPEHPKYEAGNPYEYAIQAYYRYCDQEVGEVLSLLPEDTVVFVVSDHGARKMDGGLCVNEWLIQEGYLTLSRYPEQPTPLDKAEIEWSRTKVWGEGGYYGRLFLNVRGREPQGTIDPKEYEKVRSELIAGIEAIEDPNGRNIGSKAYRPEDLYRTCRGIPPDLLVYFGNLDWRSVGAVGLHSMYTFENDTGPDDANHDWHGIFMMRSPNGVTQPRGQLEGLRLFDLAPTLLTLFGLEPWPDRLGRSLV